MSSRTQTIDSPPSARAVSPAIPSPLLVAELRPEMFAVPVPEQMDDVGAQPLTESPELDGARSPWINRPGPDDHHVEVVVEGSDQHLP
jgi:hypothetical protein